VSHYDIIRWTDYVRGVLTSPEHHEMTLHLAECSSCRGTHDLLARVASFAKTDEQYEVPEYALRNARALFSAHARPARSMLQKLVGALVLEAWEQPQLAGVRSSGADGTRHALYEGGEYSVDLRLEAQPGSQRTSMVGQLALRSASISVDNIPVRLMSGRQVLAEAVSNQFGEFQLSYEPKRQLKLQIPIHSRGEQIELQLGTLVPKKRRRPSRKQ
jgi:hypothetical protein